MSIATHQEAIDRGQVSTYLALIDNEKGNLFSPRLSSPASPRTIQMVTSALSWGYNSGGETAQTETSLRQTTNYLIWLCGKYGQQAQYILNQTGGGGSVIPGGSTNDSGFFPFVITGVDFESDGVTYNNSKLLGKNIQLWVSQYNSDWQTAPLFFVYTSTGFKIITAGFNANDFPFIRIDKFNSPDSDFSPIPILLPIEIDYDLSADTLITNPSSITTAGQPVIISIKPNGFNYTWDTNFEFSDTEPETPSPIGVDTLQIYSFNYLASANKLVCISQSLNVPI